MFLYFYYRRAGIPDKYCADIERKLNAPAYVSA
jgi:hypothetical protein